MIEKYRKEPIVSILTGYQRYVAKPSGHQVLVQCRRKAYSQHFPLNMDSMAGEASYDMGTGAASHGPAPVSDGDRDRVKQIQELAHTHNHVLELEASAKRNMANAGIRRNKN